MVNVHDCQTCLIFKKEHLIISQFHDLNANLDQEKCPSLCLLYKSKTSCFTEMLSDISFSFLTQSICGKVLLHALLSKFSLIDHTPGIVDLKKMTRQTIILILRIRISGSKDSKVRVIFYSLLETYILWHMTAFFQCALPHLHFIVSFYWCHFILFLCA